jgi:hypothetical protein
MLQGKKCGRRFGMTILTASGRVSLLKVRMHAKTDNWKEGSKVLFLDPNGSGMVSMVAKNNPNEYMSFKHLGVVKDGQEDTTSDEVKGWQGAMENYTLKEVDGKTRLLVEMDATDDFSDYFNNTWPKALERLKKLAELN